MHTPSPIAVRVDRLPLWRLLVMLDDTERTIGADSDTARVLTGEIRRRLGDLPDGWNLKKASAEGGTDVA
jgi:hypothetical protein